MLRLLCVLGLVVAGALAGALREKRDADCQCPNPSYGERSYYGRKGWDADVYEGRLLNQEARLTQLEGYLQGLVDRYEKFASGRDARMNRWNILRERVWGLEKHHCDDEHFSCRDEVFTCVGHNQVCDGHKDCLNGHDEDEETCTVVSGVGSAFEGTLIDPPTCTKRKPTTVRFVVTGVDIRPNFPEEPLVHASVIFHYKKDGEETDESLSVDGVYDYTHRRIVLYSPDNDYMSFDCVFPRYDDNHCEGKFHLASGDTCAQFRLHRIDH
jgi:hypothetical protein